jgi:hypothetical protein
MRHVQGLLLSVVVAGLTGGQVKADPEKADPYAITPEAGQWVICAASFMGGDAHYLADQLVEELRTKHKLAAHVYDRGDADRQRELEEHRKKEEYYGVPLPFRHARYQECCAVLIGGFTDMDSATAALAKIKKLPTPTLHLSNGQEAYDRITFTEIDPKTKKADQKSIISNPLRNCFVTRNPTAPPPKVDAPKVDPLWKELNAPEPYSLLKNPKSWTLIVKEYPGIGKIDNRAEARSVVQRDSMLGPKPGDGITAAGFQAHKLAEFLRDKHIGLDAYVLHTRSASYVTVGAFDSPDDPEMKKMIRQLQALSFRTAPQGSPTNIKGDPIGLLPQPLPVEVPRF